MEASTIFAFLLGSVFGSLMAGFGVDMAFGMFPCLYLLTLLLTNVIAPAPVACPAYLLPLTFFGHFSTGLSPCVVILKPFYPYLVQAYFGQLVAYSSYHSLRKRPPSDEDEGEFRRGVRLVGFECIVCSLQGGTSV